MHCCVFCMCNEIFLVSKQIRKSWYSKTKKKLHLYTHAAIHDQVQEFWRKPKKLRLFSHIKSLKPGSDAVFFISRTWFKLRPAKLIQTPMLIAAELSSRKAKNAHFGQNFYKIVVLIIYGLGLVHEKFGVWIKTIPKLFQRWNSRLGEAKRTAEPFQIEIGVPNWFRRQTFYVLNSMYQVLLMKRLASEPGLRL